MSMHYSDPERASNTYALPDVEVFYRTAAAIASDVAVYGGDTWTNGDGEPLGAGWYYWYCFPGCMPGSDPIGPFASENEALEDARDNA